MEKRSIQDWFEVWEEDPGVFVIQEPLHTENVKSFLVTGSERALLIDTGMGIGDIRAVAEELTTLPISVLNSHAHWDHVGGNWRFDEIAIHRAEAADLQSPPAAARVRSFFADEHLTAPFPDSLDREHVEIKPTFATRLLDGGETFDLGGRSLEIVHAPGHSAGGIVILDREHGLMFSTDVVYYTGIYAFGSYSNVFDYAETLRRLEPIAAEMRMLLPSHDLCPIEPGTVGDMRAAFDEIIAGRAPDRIEDEIAYHAYDRFTIMVAPDFADQGGDA